MKVTYLQDEKSLSDQLAIPITHPLRLFNLAGIGVDQVKLMTDVLPTFETLPWDYYDYVSKQLRFLSRVFPDQAELLKAFYADFHIDEHESRVITHLVSRLPRDERDVFECIIPSRKRAVARFVCVPTRPGFWQFNRMPVGGFAQKLATDDYRAKARFFAEMSPGVADHGEFQKLLIALANIVRGVEPCLKSLTITCHQVSIVTRENSPGDNSPEGIHQDGADYIVSALVLLRQGIVGGKSLVYGPDKTTVYLEHTLEPGQGIFQADGGSPLWHYVTPIEVDGQAGSRVGTRNIFGFDFEVAR
ncbi:MAG: hypothetical protein RLZZ347_364 [Candidatus Parcubacteria bacterium]|jgi:hypothetical protein